MVVQYNLSVVRRVNLDPFYVLVQLDVRVHVYHLPVALVAEQEPRFAAARVHLEVGTVVGGTNPSLPVVVAKVCWLWHQFHFALEDWLEVLGF